MYKLFYISKGKNSLYCRPTAACKTIEEALNRHVPFDGTSRAPFPREGRRDRFDLERGVLRSAGLPDDSPQLLHLVSKQLRDLTISTAITEKQRQEAANRELRSAQALLQQEVRSHHCFASFCCLICAG